MPQDGEIVNLRRRRRVRQPNEARLADRLPPHAPEAEQGVLGCILLSPNECLGQCIEKLPDGDAVFYDLRHQTVYANLVQMYDARKPIDVISLQQRLKDFDLLEQIGGIPYLNALQDSVPSAANVTYYADIVSEKYLLRRMIQACTSIVERVYEYQGEVEPLLDEVERDILSIAESRERAGAFVSMKGPVNEAMGVIEKSMDRKGATSGIATGYPDLDVMTDGLQPGEIFVIAARPSMGKTSLAMNIAEYVCAYSKIPVGVFSLEMTRTQLALRMISSNSRINLRNMREGFLSDRDFPKLTSSAGRLSVAPLYIDDTPSLSVLQIRARARRAAQQFGIKLFVIDYLQLARSTSKRAFNREQEIADISSGVKALAKELGVPIIVLSQLNRNIERENRKPRLSDLRESGAVEQDADLVGLLYKPSKGENDDDPMPEELDGVAVNLLLGKNRNGPTGDVNLTFLKGYTRFESAARVSDEDVPRDDAQPYFPTTPTPDETPTP